MLFIKYEKTGNTVNEKIYKKMEIITKNFSYSLAILTVLVYYYISINKIKKVYMKMKGVKYI